MAMLRRFIVSILLPVSCAAWANNGLLFIGFGSESLNMGGADTAVARDTTALNTNPAGLAQVAGRAFDAYTTLTYAVDVRHSDAVGNDAGVANRFTPTFGGAYAQRLGGTNLTVGAGLFLQGGAGNKFENLRTAAGTRDELSAQLAILKVGPGLAYALGERLRLGASVAAVVATLEQKLFPGTSLLAPAPFFGLDVDDLVATGVNARLGAQYLASDRLTLAVVYSPKTELDFKEGTLRSNQTAAGFGVVTYRDARIEGFALPQELSFGAAWKSEDTRLLISAKLAWLNWDDALNQQTITASDPSGPAAAASIRRDSALNWKDQYVWALGLAYTTGFRTTFYGGLNIANNPVPPETLTPLLSAAIAQKHLTAGFSHPLRDGWKVSGGMLYVFPEKVTYTNPSLQPLLGASSQERIEYFGVNAMVGRTW
jgi:long-chain fatty acid transport protein